MDFLGFLNLLVKCIDVVAWPLVALGYPLCASIQAIETNSSSDALKLVTYWVLFSLISLIEHAFVKLLAWLPFWPYIKLITICWLVIPHFDGAFYVYEHFVRPCLSINPEIINQFGKRDEEFIKKEVCLAETKSSVEENGPEVLEELISNKLKWEEDFIAQKDINLVEGTEIKEEAEANRANRTETNFLANRTETNLQENQSETNLQKNRIETNLPKTENKKYTAVAMEEIPAAREVPNIPAAMKVQKQWTCAICQVTTQSEITLNSHLLGRRHKEHCEVLKQAAKKKSVPASPAKKSDQRKEAQEKFAPDKGLNREMPKKQAEKTQSQQQNQKKGADTKQGKGADQRKEAQEKFAPGKGFSREMPKKQEEKTQSQQQNQKKGADTKQGKGVEMKQSMLRCYICNVKCTSEVDMASHCKGRRHLLRIQELASTGGGGGHA